MTDYVLWLHGLRGPEIQILRNRDPAGILNETERLRKISGPVEITAMNAEMTIAEAAHWFPLNIKDEEET